VMRSGLGVALRSRPAVLLGVVVAVAFLVSWGGLLTGSALPTHDSIIWYGSFHYFVTEAARGTIPLWDPYTIAGTPYYPNIPIHGLLDPLVLAVVAAVKAFGIHPLTGYVYFFVARIVLYAGGACLLFHRISGCARSAVLAAGILLLAITPTCLRQNGIIQNAFLSPLAMYLVVSLFEETSARRRAFLVAALALVTGISLEVFIPAYFVFNLLLFTIGVVATRPHASMQLVRDRRFLLTAGAGVLVVALMAAPAITLFAEFRSPAGEHFPSVRIVQKSNEYYRKMVASDQGRELLSPELTNHKGVYSSTGNLLHLIHPDLWRSYFGGGSGASPGCRSACSESISEAFVYIGIIPLLAAMLGACLSGGRYRRLALAMLLVMTVNMVSLQGVHDRSPNGLQRAFNAVFPILETMEVRETLSGFFLLYACTLVCLGFQRIFQGETMVALVRTRLPSMAAVVGAILLAKLALTALHFDRLIATSAADSAAVAILFLALFGLAGLRAGRVSARQLAFAAAAVALADVAAYGLTLRTFVIQENRAGPFLAAPGHDPAGFQYFRDDFEAARMKRDRLAFLEMVRERKGAMSRGNDHHFFTTMRYYDYFTHVPLEGQVTLSGIDAPIVRFYPDTAVAILPDRRAVLGRLAGVRRPDDTDILFLEEREAFPLAEPRGLDAFEELVGLDPNVIRTALTRPAVSRRISEGRANLSSWLDAPGRSLRARSLSPNEVRIDVQTDVDGYLLYSDGWSRHWRAFDNDREISPRVANYAFKAVRLTKGAHVVRFLYDPRAYRLSLHAYWLGLIAAAVWIAITKWRVRARASV